MREFNHITSTSWSDSCPNRDCLFQSRDAAPHRKRLGTLSPVYGGPAESGIASGRGLSADPARPMPGMIDERRSAGRGRLSFTGISRLSGRPTPGSTRALPTIRDYFRRPRTSRTRCRKSSGFNARQTHSPAAGASLCAACAPGSANRHIIGGQPDRSCKADIRAHGLPPCDPPAIRALHVRFP